VIVLSSSCEPPLFVTTRLADVNVSVLPDIETVTRFGAGSMDVTLTAVPVALSATATPIDPVKLQFIWAPADRALSFGQSSTALIL
jgi:hypothetical protein